MIPLILYGESPKNPTAGTKAELDRPGTPSYRRYFIYRTKTASPSSSACPLDSLARSKGGIRINIRRWRMKLQPALSAVFLSSSFPFPFSFVAAASARCCPSLDDRRQETNERRSSCPLRGTMGNEHDLKRFDATTSYILDNTYRLFKTAPLDSTTDFGSIIFVSRSDCWCRPLASFSCGIFF